MARARAINLAAGAAALPLEVLERASAEFVETDHSGMSFLAWASTDVTPLLSHFVFPWHPSWEVSLKWAIAPSRFIKSWSVRKAPSESFSASPTRTRSHATCMATQQIAFAIDVGALLQRRRHTPVLCHSSQPARQTGKSRDLRFLFMYSMDYLTLMTCKEDGMKASLRPCLSEYSPKSCELHSVLCYQGIT